MTGSTRPSIRRPDRAPPPRTSTIAARSSSPFPRGSSSSSGLLAASNDGPRQHTHPAVAGLRRSPSPSCLAVLTAAASAPSRDGLADGGAVHAHPAQAHGTVCHRSHDAAPDRRRPAGSVDAGSRAGADGHCHVPGTGRRALPAQPLVLPGPQVQHRSRRASPRPRPTSRRGPLTWRGPARTRERPRPRPVCPAAAHRLAGGVVLARVRRVSRGEHGAHRGSRQPRLRRGVPRSHLRRAGGRVPRRPAGASGRRDSKQRPEGAGGGLQAGDRHPRGRHAVGARSARRVDGGRNPDTERRRLPRGLRGALDLRHLSMFGYLDGGYTAGESMVGDRRIDAGSTSTGRWPTVSASARTGRISPARSRRGDSPPVHVVRERAPQPRQHRPPPAGDPSWGEFWSNQRGWKLDITLRQSAHGSFSDLQVGGPRSPARSASRPARRAPHRND